MISVSEAKNIIVEQVGLLDPSRLSLKEATGKLLKEDIYSTIDLPPFNQSSVDGYAFCYNDWIKNNPLVIEGEIQAGDAMNKTIQGNGALRIFTGAPVPIGADTVVMQEKVTIEKDRLIINDNSIQQGSNIRILGAELTKGTLALKKDTLLQPGAIAFLASMGIKDALVIPNPTISIIITGNELQESGKDLDSGKIYEANSFALTSALHQKHITDITIYYVRDTLDELTQTLNKCLLLSDLILITGGVSVGEYDFVIKASENCGIKKHFHKIKQRPGKPLFFGKKENKIIFGLPGNPASVLTCYYEYVLLALEVLTGKAQCLEKINSILKTSFSKPAGLTHFLKGWHDGNTASISAGQESYKLSSFAKANCLIVIEENTTEATAGEMIEIHLLP